MQQLIYLPELNHNQTELFWKWAEWGCKCDLDGYEAAKFYGIPKSTLSDKVSGWSPMPIKKGPDPSLSLELEEEIEKY